MGVVGRFTIGSAVDGSEYTLCTGKVDGKVRGDGIEIASYISSSDQHLVLLRFYEMINLGMDHLTKNIIQVNHGSIFKLELANLRAKW
ncbi:unnamed protein product [Lepeophtheirus salmonis]|uniref:(salmon louse) hypothetical protein n=1 Tax=Lepeophtheirus salmonis TaxID=72036 RepID=A0A7R8HD52_LEPSM|nr:unnamed protein product [Lepeophtheirus salmonis]CAF3027478.1 unnamed protein product [Lepeophtheirus salmonis]